MARCDSQFHGRFHHFRHPSGHVFWHVFCLRLCRNSRRWCPKCFSISTTWSWGTESHETWEKKTKKKSPQILVHLVHLVPIKFDCFIQFHATNLKVTWRLIIRERWRMLVCSWSASFWGKSVKSQAMPCQAKPQGTNKLDTARYSFVIVVIVVVESNCIHDICSDWVSICSSGKWWKMRPVPPSSQVASWTWHLRCLWVKQPSCGVVDFFDRVGWHVSNVSNRNGRCFASFASFASFAL